MAKDSETVSANPEISPFIPFRLHFANKHARKCIIINPIPTYTFFSIVSAIIESVKSNKDIKNII